MTVSVLICDDSSMARKQIARALPAGLGANVRFAVNGEEALQQLRRDRVDLVFLDLTMPVLDGYQTLEALAQWGERRPQVVVVSGDIQPDARRRVLTLGALEFIKKPVDQSGLSEILTRLGLIAGPEPVAAHEFAIDVDLRDGYREIANIAMGQAADLLARLLDVFVILPLPNVNVLEVGELRMALSAAEHYDSVSAVCQGYIGAGISGEALLLFNDASFADIARLMRYEGELDESVELELLMDVANVLIGACLKGIADQLDIRFSQNHPTVLGRHCKVGELIAANSQRWRTMLAIEISYRIEDYRINCDLLLLFTEDSVPSLNQKIAHLIDG